MGTADLIPGISGGTIALILGVYEPFIDALKSFNSTFFKNVLLGHWKNAFLNEKIKFLFSLVTGMIIAIASLVQVIQFLLLSDKFRPLLYSLFLGLVLASVHIITNRLSHISIKHLILASISGLVAFYVSGLEVKESALQMSNSFYVWVFFCGVAGVCAMLLPGISGSYLLNVLGIYGLIITALSSTFQSITFAKVEWEYVKILFVLGSGIVFGALVFSRFISWALQYYHQLTITLLIGFMLGSLRSLWPFWIKSDFNLQPSLPSVFQIESWIALLCFCLGFLIVIYLDKKKSRSYKILNY